MIQIDEVKQIIVDIFDMVEPEDRLAALEELSSWSGYGLSTLKRMLRKYEELEYEEDYQLEEVDAADIIEEIRSYADDDYDPYAIQVNDGDPTPLDFH